MGLIDTINLFALIMGVLIFAPWLILYGVYVFGNKKQSKTAEKTIRQAKREMGKIEREKTKRSKGNVFMGGGF